MILVVVLRVLWTAAKTARHFADAKALVDHKKSRYYKRRCKELKEEKYTQASAELAGGMTKEKLPPAHGAAGGKKGA